MNIGYDAKRLFHNHSGLGNFSRLVVDYIANDSNHEITLYDKNAQETRYKEYLRDRFKVVTSSIPLWREFFMMRDIKKDNIDLFHGLSHSLPLGIQSSGIPSIVTIHDIIFKKFPSDFPFVDRQIYHRKWVHSIRNSTVIHAISKSTADDIIKTFGVPAKKIEVIYVSVPQYLMEMEFHMDIAKKYQLHEPYFLFVGDLGKRKNVSLIINAIRNIHANNKKSGEESQVINNIRLKVVSNDLKGQKNLMQLIKSDGLDNRIQFYNKVSNEELYHFYKNSEALIYPSFYEGFGLPILEAMALGTPVIASTSSSLPEVGGSAVLYVDPENVDELAEKMLSILNNPNLASKLSEKGIARSKLFSPEKFSRELLELYESVVK